MSEIILVSNMKHPGRAVVCGRRRGPLIVQADHLGGGCGQHLGMIMKQSAVEASSVLLVVRRWLLTRLG